MNLVRLFWGWVFAYVSRIHTASVSAYLHCRYLKCLLTGFLDLFFFKFFSSYHGNHHHSTKNEVKYFWIFFGSIEGSQIQDSGCFIGQCRYRKYSIHQFQPPKVRKSKSKFFRVDPPFCSFFLGGGCFQHRKCWRIPRKFFEARFLLACFLVPVFVGFTLPFGEDWFVVIKNLFLPNSRSDFLLLPNFVVFVDSFARHRCFHRLITETNLKADIPERRSAYTPEI